MKVKAIAVLAVSILLPASLAGCGREESSAGTADTAAAYEAARQKGEEDARAAEQARLEAQAQALAAANKACVQSVLDADAAVSFKSEPDVQAQKMREIDTSACPGDFRRAYELHIQAWENKGRIAQAWARLNSEDNINGTFAASMFAGIFGTNDTPIKDHLAAERELKRLAAIAGQNINDTFDEVKAISVGYGATLPS